MLKPVMLEVQIDETPEPGTDEMCALLHHILEGVLKGLPFDFAASDVMSVSTKLLLDVGMIAVMEGKTTRDELISDVHEVFKMNAKEWTPDKSTLEYRKGVTAQ